MPKARQFRNTFQAGHLDKQFLARSDAEQYREGCEILENFELLLGGGARRRPGTKHLSNQAMGQRLIKFEADADNTFMIELRYQQNQGSIVWWSPDNPTVRAVVNWDELLEAHVWEVDYASFFDTLILTHTDAGMKVITRSGASLVVSGPY